MKNRDLILIGSILLIALIIFACLALFSRDGAYVTVKIDGEEIASYPLDKDGVFVLCDGKNILKIEDGKAYMTHADCPDKLCVKRGEISRSGETITCLPHKLTVTVHSDDGEVELTVD